MGGNHARLSPSRFRNRKPLSSELLFNISRERGCRIDNNELFLPASVSGMLLLQLPETVLLFYSSTKGGILYLTLAPLSLSLGKVALSQA